jgi:putative hydrolase of the HAD superfamily
MIILIDLDNTLIVNPFETGVFPYLANMLEKEKSGIDYIEMFQLEAIRRRRNQRLLDSYDWDSIVQTVASALNLNVDVDVSEIVERFCEPDFISLVPNAIEILQFLRRDSHKVVLVSNGFMKYQLPVIKALQLDSSFDKLLTSDKIGLIKPQPEFFKLAVSSVGGHNNDRSMIIGDSLLHDIWGGAMAGLETVWLTSDSHRQNSVSRLVDHSIEITTESRNEGLEWMVGQIPNVEVRHIQDLLQIKDLIH